jgi:HD-GYP domain-containing protein (c-di-GMP phosphodiesterase class II)
MRADSSSAFDPRCVEALERMLEQERSGSMRTRELALVR